MQALITTHDLTKSYGNQTVVKRINLRVQEGAIYGFLGPNGAGKTTTMRMMLGLAQPTGGAISLFGKEMNAHNRMAMLRDVGSLIESPAYYGHLSGKENLMILAKLRDLRVDDVDDALKIVRLDEQNSKPVRAYSLGMKQRLGIAAAILSHPKLLILDEPVNGLDPAGMQEMRELIRSLPELYGSTVFISSHLLSEVDQLATHIGIIRKGELVFEDELAMLHLMNDARIIMRTTEGERTLPDMGDQELAQITLDLAKSGVGIIRLERREKSLEQIFLELTGTAVSL